MGQRNPDRYSMRERRPSAETLSRMIAGHWAVISSCRQCGLQMVVDLALLARLKGPNFSLWNRKAPCRRIGCPGFVVFRGKAPGMTGFEELAAPD